MKILSSLPLLLSPWACQVSVDDQDEDSTPGVDDDTTGASDDDTTPLPDDDTSDDDSTADDDTGGDDDSWWIPNPSYEASLRVEVDGETFDFSDLWGPIEVWYAPPGPGDLCIPAWWLHASKPDGSWFTWYTLPIFPSFLEPGLESDLSIPTESVMSDDGEDPDYVHFWYPDAGRGMYRVARYGTVLIQSILDDTIVFGYSGVQLCDSPTNQGREGRRGLGTPVFSGG